MRTDFIKTLPRFLTLLFLLLSMVACQSLPNTADQQAVVDAALARDDAMRELDMQALDAIEKKLSQQQAISEPEAVIYALKHNPAFNAQLVDLKIVQADLVTAGLIPNPELLYSFGVSSKPYRYSIDFPLEALWQRPVKVRKMKHLADATALRLTQSGLDLIKTVRIAYAETVLAEEALTAMQARSKLAEKIVALSKKRLALGDISTTDLIRLQQASSQSKLAKDQAAFDLAVKKNNLRYQLGLSEPSPPLVLSTALLPACKVMSLKSFQSISIAQRPDVLAAEQAVFAAKEQVKLSKVSWFKLIGSTDATSGEKTGHELSPTFRTTVPIANRNKGAISRAEAELEKAIWNLNVTKQAAILASQQAYLQYLRSCQTWQTHQSQVLTAVEQSNALIKLAYQDGEVSYLDTLQSQQALTQAELTSVGIKNNLISQWAELRRNVSKKDATVQDKRSTK